MMWDDNTRYWDSASIPTNDVDDLWELFHENSKIGLFSDFPPTEQVRAVMGELYESLPHLGYAVTALPAPSTRAECDVYEAMFNRYSPPALSSQPVGLDTLSNLLYYSYGVTRTPVAEGSEERSFRIVPSGGALYPLEIYFYAQAVDGLELGLYHYDPLKHSVAKLADQSVREDILGSFLQRDIIEVAPVVMLISGVFQRATFKYGARGYRFVLIEAGHVMQNANLAACAEGLVARNLGGYFDRSLDEALDLDGVNHSIVYASAIGAEETT